MDKNELGGGLGFPLPDFGSFNANPMEDMDLLDFFENELNLAGEKGCHYESAAILKKRFYSTLNPEEFLLNVDDNKESGPSNMKTFGFFDNFSKGESLIRIDSEFETPLPRLLNRNISVGHVIDGSYETPKL